MATVRAFLKRTFGQDLSNNNNNLLSGSSNTDSSSDTSSSLTERFNSQTNDGYSSTSTLGVSSVHSDDSMRRPLLNVHTRLRRKRFLSRFIHNSTTTTMHLEHEQPMEDDVCLLDKKLPKELVLR